MTPDALLETWRIHNRIHLYLLDALTEPQLTLSPQPKGRSVFSQFAHLHNVRLMWLKSAAPDLMESVSKVEADQGSHDELKSALVSSSAVIEQLLARAWEHGKVKGFKPHPTAFLGYLISHESHHRGQIILTLKQNGAMPPKSVLFGLWEWGTR